MTHPNKGKHGCSIFLMFIAVVGIVSGGLLVLQNLSLEISGVVTVAEVVDLEATPSSKNQRDTAKVEYYLVVEFQSEKGDTISSTLDHVTFKLSEHKVGDSVSVIYNRTKPFQFLKNY